MWKKLSEWAESSTCSLLLAAVASACAILHFGDFVRKGIEESR